MFLLFYKGIKIYNFKHTFNKGNWNFDIIIVLFHAQYIFPCMFYYVLEAGELVFCDTTDSNRLLLSDYYYFIVCDIYWEMCECVWNQLIKPTIQFYIYYRCILYS